MQDDYTRKFDVVDKRTETKEILLSVRGNGENLSTGLSLYGKAEGGNFL